MQSQSCSKASEGLMLFLTGKQEQLKKLLTDLVKNGIKEKQKQSKDNRNEAKYYLNQDIRFEEQDKKQVVKLRNKAQRKAQFCAMCPQNEQVYLLSAANFVYLSMPKLKTFRKYSHYIIAPLDHMQTRIGADQVITQEIKNYQKCLTQMFDKMNLHAIYLQQFSSNNSHIYIQCIAIPLKKAYDLPFFFKQALQGVQGFWTTHKNIIQIKKQKGGLQKQIPKQMKYFYIDFGLGYGYAHVIEQQKYWNRNFCYQIIASALGMETFEVKTTEQYSQQDLDLKKKQFDRNWDNYNWTKLI